MSVDDDVIKKIRRQRPYNCESRQILKHLFPRSRILFLFLISIIFSFLLRSIIILPGMSRSHTETTAMRETRFRRDESHEMA